MGAAAPLLADSHCHLDFDEFAAELDQIVARARASGVGPLLTISTHLDRFDRVLAIAERYQGVYCSVGVHPHESAAHGGLAAERLVELAGHPKVVAIGETGLDYHYDHSPREAQRQMFRLHIQAARATGLPLVVHTREADTDTIRLLAEGAPVRGVIHCFSSGAYLAEESLKIGLYLSFSGILTFKKAEAIRSVAMAAPEDRILVETDSPYLAPVPFRGRRNEPAHVTHTAACLAQLRGRAPAEIALHTTANFHRLFAKTDPAPCG